MEPPRKRHFLELGVVLTGLSLSGGTSIVFDILRSVPKNVKITILLPDIGALRFGNAFSEEISQLNAELRFLKEDTNSYDLILLTFWATIPNVLQAKIKAREFLFFCQSLEDRFYAEPNNALTSEIKAVQEVYGIDLPIWTEASWIKSALDARPNRTRKAKLAPNPILSQYQAKKPLSKYKGVSPKKLVVVIEGHDAWFKGVSTALKAIKEVNGIEMELHIVGGRHSLPSFQANIRPVIHGVLSRYEFQRILSNADCLIKMSHVEGMYGPPLEAFSYGTTCITSAVTGSEEFIRHLENAIVVQIGDYFGVARWLESLSKNRKLLESLNSGAYKTSLTWSENTMQDFFYDEFLKKIPKDKTPKTLSSYIERLNNPWNHILSNSSKNASRQQQIRLLLSLSWNLLRKGKLIELIKKTKRYMTYKYA